MTPAPPHGAERPLRRDAAHNRDRLLAAADEVFDARGLDASVAEVARVAGVGMGTLYRRFACKEALIDALVRELLGATIELATDALDHPGGTGLEDFLEAASTYYAAHRGCLPRLWETEQEMRQSTRHAIAELLDDAQRHGRIRPDLTTTDLTMAMWSMHRVLVATRVAAPDAWRRHLELLVAGMRPTSGTFRHPPVARADVDAIVGSPTRPSPTRPSPTPARPRPDSRSG